MVLVCAKVTAGPLSRLSVMNGFKVDPKSLPKTVIVYVHKKTDYHFVHC